MSLYTYACSTYTVCIRLKALSRFIISPCRKLRPLLQRLYFITGLGVIRLYTITSASLQNEMYKLDCNKKTLLDENSTWLLYNTHAFRDGQLILQMEPYHFVLSDIHLHPAVYIHLHSSILHTGMCLQW